MFCSCVRLTVLVSWMVPFRDAKENLVTNRDDPFAIGQRCAANTLTFRAHAPIPYNPMFATLDLKFAHLDGFHVSGLVSAIRIASTTMMSGESISILVHAANHG